jgi:hypothetical protein
VRSEDIKHLQEAAAGLDADLSVVQDGRVLYCVGTIATLYFSEGSRPETRERLASAVDTYRRAIGDRLVWGADPFTHQAKKLAGTDIADVRAWMHRVGPREPVDIMLHAGQNQDDASPYRVVAAARSLRSTELSYFSFSLPFAWLAAHDVGAFTKLVIDECNLLAPTHGYAGLAVVPHVDISRQSPEMAPILGLVARFAGLELDLPGSHAIYLEQENRIKGVNWLTILSDSWIEKLGGEKDLREKLGEGIELHRFNTGVVIQAGPRPLFGDAHRQEAMPHYKQVARALKPIRIDSVRALSTPNGFDRDRSDRWLARFDD